ncbi:Serine/threonine-protein kinase PrkC [Bhargavaea cecembensis DSE10]|uniref:Serine/threonine-protein kinase PrkC n=1 Tax=Bhargavaea cecembensis DSE10 TaxID=1235279 RepID=M7PAQ1_9BACL|nr:Stk1 family PASTA domain-containing Ser/Thr kinase [Bhargavaea cecembensis]EMR07564.1 Serine/threonine-protein kinase PrkC [Bhargavaea cecembensis DSE10]
MIGKRISGRYEVLGLLGGGGMSTVYLAQDIILDRPVAIKVLRQDFSDENELRKRFQREALSATSLVHPNIVNIYDVGEDGDLQYLVMEYVEGQTLKEYIKDRAPLAPAEAVEIMKQLCSGITAAHIHGIIHRDIKPQNILMDREGQVKLTDFGIAMALSATALTRTNSVMGTVHYLSPEQARGGMATERTDIYSLGIVLFEILTGKLPFSGESAVSIALKHLQEQTPSVRALRPEIPQSLENVILKATAKDSAARYPSADAMLRDLHTVLSPERSGEAPYEPPPIDEEATRAIPVIRDEPTSEKTIGPKPVVPPSTEPADEPQAPKKKKRKKWPFVLGGIILLALIAGIVLYMTGVIGTRQAEVPDVAGMTVEEASAELEQAGFLAGDINEEHSADIGEGSVIRTSPQAGRVRDEGETIDLVVSMGPEKVELTDFTGRDHEAISDVIEDYGFRNVEVNEVFSEEAPGTIISQEPEAGEEIAPSQTDLVLTVSKGVEMIGTEDLSGFDEQQLNDYAKRSGFNIRIVAEQPSGSIEAGKVISQNPEAGTELEKGSTIEVVLSKGPESKPVKTYIQSITIPYEPAEEGAEQAVEIYIRDNTRTMDQPAESFAISADETRRIRLEISEGQTGAYKIVRDGDTIDEATIPYE